jgi:hypothetical protein
MASLAAIEQRSSDGRHFRRVRLNLFGSCMLADGRESRCQILDMSPGGIAVAGLVHVLARERVVVYADHLGRLEGTTVRMRPGGFAATILASPRKRDKLATQLTWLANRELLDDDHLRRHQRRAPGDPRSVLTMRDGASSPCAILDMSASGAAIASSRRPAVGMLVTIGRIQSRVVRHIDVGFVVEFTRLRDLSLLEAYIADPSDDVPGPAQQRPQTTLLRRSPPILAQGFRPTL